MEQVIESLNKISPLSGGAGNFLRQHTRRLELTKKQVLLRSGEICNEAWFIEKGLIRCFERFGGKNMCNWFMRENDIATSVVSFFTGEPSVETVQAMESSIIHSISKDILFKGLREHPDLLMLTFLITAKYYCQAREIESILRKKTSKEFYQYLLEQQPELVSRALDKNMATFMGIGLTNLYGIKDELKNKKKKVTR